MRILHLGYEDPRQPGSGGGSIRTREINRRLAPHHQITVVVAGYPGARMRVEDGVRWIPIGLRTGGRLDRLAYFACLGLAITRIPHDLLVEDFGAPFSVGLSPLFSRAPVIASVQWLFARQMRQKYRLPFDWGEHAGLRLYTDFIVVSQWLGRAVATLRPDARVTTIANGVPAEAFETSPQRGRHLLFLGRLDLAQKGCDLLLEIFARVCSQMGDQAPTLLIAGDGPDRTTVEHEVAQRHLRDRVRFLGRVEGRVKYDLIASAYAVLMPSRFETFGLVAVEAQAAGAPLVAFDIGPLAEVTGPGSAVLIRPFDVETFATAVEELVRSPARADYLRRVGRTWARQYNWEEIAAQQEGAYHSRLAQTRHCVLQPLA